MKSMYEKPAIEVTTVYTQALLVESEHGTISEDLSKESQFEEENETGIPTTFTNVWGEEEKED